MFGYDLKQAANYFLQDDKKILKMFVLYILIILNGILNSAKDFHLYYLLLILPILYLFGYLAKNNNIRILKQGNNLPELNDWKNYLIFGLKSLAGQTVYFLIYVICMGLCVFLPFAMFAKSNFLLLLMLIPLFCIGLLMVIMTVLAINIAFSINLKFKSMFDFKLLKQIMFDNYRHFMRLLSVSIVLGILNLTVSVVLAVTIIGILLIPLVQVYLYLIMSDLYGQFMAKVTNVGEGQ